MAFSLTEREVQILRLLRQGMGGREICESLFITDSTLRKHVHNIYEKTGCHSRVQLVRKLDTECLVPLKS